jgi:hypothetical protein
VTGRMRAGRVGSTLALAVALTGFLAVGPAAATPQPPIEVIPGGPAVVLSGSYEGSGTAFPTANALSCPGGTWMQDMTGDFTHPTLGDGVYEFHLQLCLNGGVSGKGTFTLDGSARSLSGTLVMPVAPLEPFTPFIPYTHHLKASGGCIAHFRADGVMRQLATVTDPLPWPFEEVGTLTQTGAIVCRASR